jgi:hypothetical protein
MEIQWFPTPRSKKFKTQTSSNKVLASVFWDKDGVLLAYYLYKQSYYVALLDKLKHQLVSKLRGKLSKGILFLQEHAAPHKAAIRHQKFAALHFKVLKHPAYYLIRPFRTTTSFLTSREESFRAVRRPQ